MLTFAYDARDPKSGRKVSSVVEADSEQSAAKLIHAQGLSPLDIRLKRTTHDGLMGRISNHIRTKDKIIFSRQLSTLINAGLPLVQSLRSILTQTKSKPLQQVVSKLISDVEAGSSFSDALGRHPKVFNQVFISLVAAGEASGTLDTSLERMANQQEKDAEIISKVRGAMVYPIIVLLVMVGIVGFMLVSVLPQVEELYRGLPGANLPLVTKVLLASSHFIIRFWWVVILIFLAGGFSTFRWLRTLGGKRVADRAKMVVPPLNGLFMKVYMARFARTGTTLVGSGVPLLQVLNITADAVNNVHIAESIHKAAEKVKGGKSLSTAIENDPNFLDLVPNMLRIGEESGQIESMLAKTAEYYEKEVDNEVKAISTIIEPVLMIILGVVAIVIVAAVLLPIYSLVGSGVIK